MKASEVAKWHGKACVVTLKQGSVLMCNLYRYNSRCLRGFTKLHLVGVGEMCPVLNHEIKSIKARKP